MKLLAKIKKILGNFKLRQRMLLIYIAGGILPILFSDIYMYHTTRQILIQQAKETEVDELSMIADSMRESMSVVADISRQMYFDEKIEHIAFHKYDSYAEILEDYRNYDTSYNYLKFYYHEILSITLYMNNDTISNNEYFVYADKGIRDAKWYQKTIELEGRPYWSYEYDILKKKNYFRLSRVLYNRDMKQVGVLAVNMQYKRTELPVQERTQKTFLVYDDDVVLHYNFKEDNFAELTQLLKEQEQEVFSGRVFYKGEDCLLSMVRITPDYSEDYYTLVSICGYDEIAAAAAQNALSSLVPQFACVILALAILLFFSNQFSARVNVFKNEMHKAANGEFDIAARIEGGDEIAELYQDLNVMIHDIQELMTNVIRERVQKEQVNARQREVEFKMLASQINPHFLYNTLETIRMQARIKGQPDIEELAKMLAKIMRRNIQVSNTIQPLKAELQLVEYYLKIQDYRFHDRIHSSIEVNEDEIIGIKVMPLLIQPFVENAFVHGLEGKEGDGYIRIIVEVRTHLWITVEDNGCGMSAEKLQEIRETLTDFENLDRTHIGICNVNQRIKLQYGNDYGVTFESVEGTGTTAVIKLPRLTAEML